MREERPQRSVNGTTPRGQEVSLETLTALVHREHHRDDITPEDPAHATAADLELLHRIHTLGPLGPFATLRHRAAVSRLVREGLLSLDGVLDEAGEGFMDTVSAAHDVVAVRGQCGAEQTLMQCWIGTERAAVVAGASGADLLASVTDELTELTALTALTVDRSSLVSHVCDWAGVRTFPAGLPGELLLTEADFAQRVGNGCTPMPPDLGATDPVQPGLADRESLAAWWTAPWFVWDLTSTRLGVNIGLISANTAGNAVFGLDDRASERAGQAMIRVAPVTAQAVWETVWLLAHNGGKALAP